MILGIDPSVNNVGVAYTRTDRVSDLQWFQIDPIGGGIEERAKYIVKRLRLLGLQNSNFGVIEYPCFQHSQRGHIAAQKGYTNDLAFVCGYIVASMPDVGWLMPTPNQWKGNQTKVAMGAKFESWTGTPYSQVSDHCYEAAMMIKWFLDNAKKHR